MSNANTSSSVKKTTENEEVKKVSKNFLIGQTKANLRTLKHFVGSVDSSIKNSNSVSRDISWALSRMAFIIQNFYQFRNINVSLTTIETMPIFEALSKMQRKKEQLRLKDDENKIKKIKEIERIEKELSDIALKVLNSDLLS